jgi:two-component sensor histidine kinase/CheY-like chemotaxis protein
MKGKQIKVLLIEDNPGDARFIQEMLGEKRSANFDLVCADKLQTGMEHLAKGDIDVVLLDLGLPDSQGLDTLIKIQAQAPEVPIVVFTGLNDEKTGLEAVKRGAQDYLVKGTTNGNLLASAIRYAIERKWTEEKIKASLREKNVLLREIHHRVKNNMQVISSLLNLQSRHADDEKALDMLRGIQNRVKSMTLIHERLYQSEDIAKVSFAEHVQTLTSHLFSSYGVEARTVKLSINIKDVLLDINTAIPCSLIINEIVSNSLKHAFPDGRKGEIKVAMHLINKKEIRLVLSDDGVGLPEDVDFRKTESLGLHLVRLLAENQLHGDIKLDRTKGTNFNIRLKVKR